MIIFAYHVIGDDIRFFKSTASNEIEGMQQLLRHLDLHDDYEDSVDQGYDGDILDWLAESDMYVGWIKL